MAPQFYGESSTINALVNGQPVQVDVYHYLVDTYGLDYEDR